VITTSSISTVIGKMEEKKASTETAVDILSGDVETQGSQTRLAYHPLHVVDIPVRLPMNITHPSYQVKLTRFHLVYVFSTARTSATLA
jgi:hypothetical protein